MVKIITDSSCDIDLDMARELDIEVIPIQVHFEEESYFSGVDLSNEEFYEKLKTVEKLPTTSQITPLVFEEVFSKHLAAGDEIVGMFISKEMSGTYQNAVITQTALDSGRIHIVDTLNTTFGLALLLQEAVQMRDNGLSGKEIAAKIAELVPRVCLLASVETLKYLKMGGRLSAATAMIGGILGIYPIISVVGGKVEAVGKARGRAAANKVIEEKIKSIGISSDYCVTYGNSYVPEVGRQTEKYFADYVGKRKILRTQIGCIVGTHVGPGASGLAFIKK